MGASVGLTDQHLLAQKLNLGYAFQEVGYRTTVNCAVNTSAAYEIHHSSEGELVWFAEGPPPNSSPGTTELSRYFGFNSGNIVAIGVAYDPIDTSRIISIAAGKYYAYLDKMQCTLSFLPAAFNVSVELQGLNITVTPLNGGPKSFGDA